MVSEIPPSPGEWAGTAPDGSASSPPPSAPPTQPPPLPPVLEAPEPPKHLHPFTLLLTLVRAIRGLAIPAIFVLVTGSGATLGVLLLGMLILTLIASTVRYFTLTYRIEAGELITRQGLLSRHERHIPLARVQDLRIEQGLFHRLLGVVDLLVETAGGQGVEAELSVLSRTEAERLRGAVFGERGETPLRSATSAPSGEPIRRLSLRDLVLEGLTSNRAASALVLLGAAWGMLNNAVSESVRQKWFLSMGERLGSWLVHEGETNWMALGGGAVLLIVASTVFSVAGSIVLFHGFTLIRRGEDLYRVYGLLTRRASSLPRRRIQVLQVEEPWLRRTLGLAVVRADTAGRRQGGDAARQGGRDVLLPLVRRSELPELVPVFLPDAGPDPEDWQRVDRCAIARGTFKGTVICLLTTGMLLLLWQVDWPALIPLLLIPAAFWLSVRSYRHLGFADNGAVFRTRRGWVDRTTHVVPVRNLQVVVLRQTPFDRRHGVWTLKLDTAGQAYTGGGPALGNLRETLALATARSLAARAANIRFRW
jgi:putative membrane protein